MIFLLILLSQAFGDQLVLSQILWRNGACTPTYCNWKCKEFEQQGILNGQLTPIGTRQHYVLGQWLRKRYIEDLKLLSQFYNEAEIYIESTDVNRTILSALSNLQGMYPAGTGPKINPDLNRSYLLPPNQKEFEDFGDAALPGLQQAIPVHVREKQLDIYLKGYDALACPRNEEFRNSNINSKLYYQINSKAQSLISDFTQQLGIVASQLNITDLYEYQDTFDSCEYNGYDLPKLKESTQSQMKLLQYLYFSLEHNIDFEQTRLLATPFFRNLLLNIENVINNQTEHKFRIFSAHAATVQLILNALNLTSFECVKQVYLNEKVQNKNCIYTFPGYASNIIFELYRKLGHGNQYYVQVLYNGTLMPICNNQYKCDYEEFKSRIQFQNVKDYEDECLISPKFKKEAASFILKAINVVITILFIISFCIIYLLRRQSKLEEYTKIVQQFDA
ncbi:unnamed protein product (macronuclear) [Paramecium tetraurelia]|uniref:Histidine acid phosphatase n=1 Tax=Paramecium tetraurelia TaxID=5888 RepID=A0BS05_PARTE|nr:uncharacterized protein GSPATT00031553001 [Paramecium tetraurelia]CAK61322.1 unnamed protein product [Paramecium tetraurelia]|eukprot:XP_001428720.1 hypothetical protein (macronuclear) [Paramecium tetraurelia strain d4-2]